MTLIPCPECEAEASDRALACPQCGFPIAKEIEDKLAQVTGHDRVRTARQRAAAGKLRSWSEGNLGVEPRDEAPQTFMDRHSRPLVFLAVAVVVSLQVYFIFAAIYE